LRWPTATREAEYQFGEAESLGSTPLERPVERLETSLSDRFRFGVEPPLELDEYVSRVHVKDWFVDTHRVTYPLHDDVDWASGPRGTKRNETESDRRPVTGPRPK
jgi:hypothetical protein